MASTAVDVKITVDESVEDGSIPLPSTTKSTIIDQELNQHGMGRYQWCTPLSFAITFSFIAEMLG